MSSDYTGKEAHNEHSGPGKPDLSWTLNVKGKPRTFQGPLVMGILNATPDSFSDGGEYNSVDNALKRIEEMGSQGASIVDVGGESTRPGADPVPEDEELRRVIPILERAVTQFPDLYFSIDTTKLKVAHEALDRGTHIVNDVSGLRVEPKLAGLCADYQAAYVLMHMQGMPRNMQKNPHYEDVVEDIKHFFVKQLALAEESGLDRDSILLDPGIGFGKTVQHNLQLLRRLQEFNELERPMLVGASRKSMIGKILKGRPAEERLAGTIAVHYHALLEGANVLRVHDVQEACDSVDIFCEIMQTE